MTKRQKQKPGRSGPQGNNDKHSRVKGRSRRQAAKNAVHVGNVKLIERVRQIISEAPEIRVEKVGPLQEAITQGTYQIDVRKLANILIVKMFIDP